jgi:hypothetical protein
MNVFIAALISIYSKLIVLYPRSFRKEFGEEMQVVFGDSVNEASKDGILFLVIVGMREMVNLPGSVLQEFWHEFKKKDTIMDMNGQTESKSVIKGGTSHWDALIATLPFVLFGIACLIGKIRVPFWGIYADLAFYAIVLLGLLIGLIKGVPGWSYSYLGWSLVFGWWWSSMGTEGLKIFGFQIDYWTWQIWPPLLVTIGVALLWTRSLLPLRQLVRGIWQDWTLLSLAMYAFLGFLMLPYDENHSPYLIGFMIVSTLTISASVWAFMRSPKPSVRLLTLLTGFFLALAIDRVCETTWDFAGYYGLPATPPAPWYDSIFEIMVITVVWGGLLIWPALISLVRHSRSSE